MSFNIFDSGIFDDMSKWLINFFSNCFNEYVLYTSNSLFLYVLNKNKSSFSEVSNYK